MPTTYGYSPLEFICDAIAMHDESSEDKLVYVQLHVSVCREIRAGICEGQGIAEEQLEGLIINGVPVLPSWTQIEPFGMTTGGVMVPL